MSHQSFQTWLLDEEQITAEGEEAMKEHLSNCVECQELNASWQAVQGQLRHPVMVKPTSGFSQRWKASLAERRMQQQILQMRRVFLGLAVGSFLSLGVLMIMLLNIATPANMFTAAVTELIRLFTALSEVRDVVFSWLLILPPIIPLAAWILLSTTFAVLAFAWVGSMWRISSKGEVNK